MEEGIKFKFPLLHALRFNNWAFEDDLGRMIMKLGKFLSSLSGYCLSNFVISISPNSFTALT